MEGEEIDENVRLLDSSTSDFMKLQTMGGPPEELRNGLLDDTRRQPSRTNSTRVVASMVPV